MNPQPHKAFHVGHHLFWMTLGALTLAILGLLIPTTAE